MAETTLPGQLYRCSACEVYGHGGRCWCCGSKRVEFLNADEHPLHGRELND